MDGSSQVLSRDGAYRIDLARTDRDLAMHVDAYYEAPDLVDVASGRTLLSLDAGRWTSITTLVWGKSGFQLRLMRIDLEVESFLILDPAHSRFALSPGLDGQMWNDEIADEGLDWRGGWAGSEDWLDAQFTALRSAREAARAVPTPPPAPPSAFRIAWLSVVIDDGKGLDLPVLNGPYSPSIRERSTGRLVFDLSPAIWDVSSGTYLAPDVITFYAKRIVTGLGHAFALDLPRRRYALESDSIRWDSGMPLDEVRWRSDWDRIEQGLISATGGSGVEVEQIPPSPSPVPAGLGVRIDYDEIELSMVHMQVYGTVFDAASGAMLFSLPMGRWVDTATCDSHGTPMIDFAPEHGSDAAMLRYDPARDLICRHDGASGASGRWHPSHEASQAWNDMADTCRYVAPPQVSLPGTRKPRWRSARSVLAVVLALVLLRWWIVG
ncbi:hypothetical protein [Novosphingobium lentum]|uniref:hypothetical protein n=1 Tax=Novosphingobium lentum TaxID=145287 RepID=UPI0008298CA7|nr:hypothetical protein [Novosphingobium lentum]